MINDSRPLLVLIHGWAFDSSIWAGFYNRFGDQFRVFCPDIYPFFPAMIDGLTEEIEKKAAGQKIYLVGWSLGYLLAAEIAKKMGVEKIVGLGALPFLCSEHGIKTDTIELIRKNLAINRTRAIKKFYQWAHYPERSTRSPLDTISDEALVETLIMLTQLSSVGSEQPETLFLLADKDAVLPVEALSDFTGIESRVYPERGHLFFLDDSLGVAQTIIDFFDR